jgi:GAF domain-containing protein
VRGRGFGWRRTLSGLVVGAAAVAVVTGVVGALQRAVPASALAALYVLAVLPVAGFWGVWPALIVAVVSALAFDLFFFPPLFALTPTDPHIVAILVISAVTAVVVSELAGRVRHRAGEAESLAQEVRRIAEEQAALRRVATLVARGAEPGEVFGSVAAEVGSLFGADVAVVFRFEPEHTADVVGRWSVPGTVFPDDARLRVEGVGVTVTVLNTGRPARTERFEGPAGSTAGCFAQLGARAGVGAPISVEGRLWGAVVAAAIEPERLPVGSEASIAGFTELVATAIANAQTQVERRGFAEEQAALRRVATLVARAASPEEVFAAVAAEVRRVLAVDLTVMCRYDPDSVLTYVGWSQTGHEGPVGVRVPLSGRNVAQLVFETGRPARIDDYGDASGPAADIVRPLGLRAAVGVPVNVAGRLWGVMTVASIREQPPPAGTEERLAGFTELVATAIANAQARLELRGFAEEQAALRRVATLVAQAAPPEEVFGAVAAEAGRLLEVDFTILRRFEGGEQVSVGTWWSGAGGVEPFPVGTRGRLGGRNVVSSVFETGRPARMDDYSGASGPVADAAREWGLRSAVAVPISVEGRLWGVLAVAYMHDEPLPAGTEARLAGFAELVGTAIANAQARVELRGFAEEQAALRRVATLVARAASSGEVFAAVTEEAGRLLHVDFTSMIRFDRDGAITWVGSWSATDAAFPIPVGTRAELGGRNMPTVVFETGRPARIDYADASGAVTTVARELGIRSSVGAPISVAGRLWGVLAAVSTGDEALPADTEGRLAGFAELVATALANAQAQAALTASRARIVAAADTTRRRIERDLHDGAQQRLVSLALQLRGARAVVPAGMVELRAQLDSLAAEATGTLDELRQLARGIHPPALAKGGLCPALKALARRSAVPVDLDLRVDGRLPEQIEIAAHYVVSEALTNAAKHAQAANVHVEVLIVEDDGDGVLRVRVRDDGRGGADPRGGSGLVGLKDRVEALGGALSVQTAPGAGSTVQAELPLRSGRAVSG